jgi:hypothetical protein
MVAGDPRPYARYYLRRIDLSNPAQPDLGPAINVPGEVVAVKGKKLFTRDRVWGNQYMETAIARLQLDGGVAHLRNYEVLADRQVSGVAIDEHQKPLVTHGPIWSDYSWYWGWQNQQKLSIFEPQGSGFEELSRSRLTEFSTLLKVAEHRAFFQVPGGVLMANIEDAENPFGQAFFQSGYYYQMGYWKQDVVFHEDEILMAAGRYGIHQIGVDDVNLLPQ